MPYSLLIVTGANTAEGLLTPALKAEFSLEICGSAQFALAQLRTRSFDLLVLEEELPDMPGLTFFRILRDTEAGKKAPVIFLSALKTEESMVEAFKLGADDYMTLPSDPRELAGRVRAVLRRKQSVTGDWGETLVISGVRIDPDQRRCTVNGKRIFLPPLEFALLKILMRKAGRVLTRTYLLNTVWDISRQIDTRAVDAAVSRLRRALGVRAGRMIETVSKMGYCFKDPD